MKCRYCKRISINDPMLVVREATKAAGEPYRWQRLGYCCDDCEAKGCPVTIEYVPPYVPPKIHPVEKFAANRWRNPGD